MLVFDRRFVLRTVNEGALTILNDDFDGVVGVAVDEWPRQRCAWRLHPRAVRGDRGKRGQAQLNWSAQRHAAGVAAARFAPAGGQRRRRRRGVRRRDPADRRPAQCGLGRGGPPPGPRNQEPADPDPAPAERLQFKLADKLANGDADMLARGTQTIINQVQAMKRMVDDFRDYARLPAPEVAPLDLNELIREVLGPVRSSSAVIETELADDLAAGLGDATQLRQIIHNLLRNAEDALEGRDDGRIVVETQQECRHARLRLADNGPGGSGRAAAAHFRTLCHHQIPGTGAWPAHRQEDCRGTSGQVEISNAPEGGRGSISACRFGESGGSQNGHHSGR